MMGRMGSRSPSFKSAYANSKKKSPTTTKKKSKSPSSSTTRRTIIVTSIGMVMVATLWGIINSSRITSFATTYSHPNETMMMIMATTRMKKNMNSEGLAAVKYSVSSSSKTTHQQPASQLDDRIRDEKQQRCEALQKHENGHWEHHYLYDSRNLGTTINDKDVGGNNIDDNMVIQFKESNILNSTSTQSLSSLQYYEEELDWLQGKNLPEHKFKDCSNLKDDGDGIMYSSKLGNQCGICGMDGFQPSHSIWKIGNTDDNILPGDNTNLIFKPPSLRLMERIAKANQTLCFMGDSMDYQIYDGLRNGLKRWMHQQTQHESNSQPSTTISSFDSYQTSVKYNNESGYPTAYSWGLMKDIQETILSLQIFDDDNPNGHKNSSQYKAIFRYYKTYGWAPWNTYFMDDCNIVIVNLGLHYNSQQNEMRSKHWGNPTLKDDFTAAITYMVDFVNRNIGSKNNKDAENEVYTSSEWGERLQPYGYRLRPTQSNPNKKNIAIWRSALPQHFNTYDGHYDIKIPPNCSLDTRGNGDVAIQKYNKAYELFLDMICKSNNSSLKDQSSSSSSSGCDQYEHTCTVNQRSIDTRTVYKHLIDNNCTDWLQRFFSNSISAGMMNLPSDEYSITGSILQWNIADLFDVPQWHFGNRRGESHNDCSHFCYVPSLFEAAFERLNLILPSI